jgi:hypothetical protein
MMSNDQAAGLRAMLNQAQPEVLAVVPCGAASMRWIARQAQQRAALGQRVLAFDEWQISGNFSDCLSVAPRFDLQQAVEGRVALEHCVAEALPAQSVAEPVRVLSVARLAREIDNDRILQQRTLDTLLHLQGASDEWLLIARPCDLTGLSSFARAAPRLLLVVEPVERAITEAYAALKRLARGADTLAVGICVAGADDAQSRLLLTRFRQVAASHLGIEVQAVTSVGEAIGLVGVASMDSFGATGFVERLLGRARANAAIFADGRSPAVAW